MMMVTSVGQDDTTGSSAPAGTSVATDDATGESTATGTTAGSSTALQGMHTLI